MPDTALVIVVDDHEDSRAMYALTLAASGFDVVTAATAEEALDLAQRLRADVVVADVRLPGASGLELTRQLRSDDRTRNVAILLLSGDASAGEHGGAAGSDRFLLKPVTPDALSAHIVEVMAARSSIVAGSAALRGTPVTEPDAGGPC